VQSNAQPAPPLPAFRDPPFILTPSLSADPSPRVRTRAPPQRSNLGAWRSLSDLLARWVLELTLHDPPLPAHRCGHAAGDTSLAFQRLHPRTQPRPERASISIGCRPLVP